MKHICSITIICLLIALCACRYQPQSTSNLTITAKAINGEITNFSMWKADEPARIVEYNYIDQQWISNGEGFYVEHLKPSDQFYAFHLPTDDKKDPATGLKDILTVGPVPPANNALELYFQHQMAQLNIYITSDNLSAIDITGATVSTPALFQQYDFNGTSVSVKGSKAVYQNLAAGNYLMLPQQAAGTYTIILKNGTKFTTRVPELNLTAGIRTILNLKINSQQVAVSSVSVAPWIEGTTVTASAVAVNLPSDGSTPAVDHFTIWKNNEPNKPVTYTFDSKKWFATPAPFYVDDLTEQDIFYANHIPEAEKQDPATGLVDLMATGPFSMKNRTFTLAFTHLMAQLEVKLQSDNGENIDFTGATITTPSVYTKYTLNGTSISNLNTLATYKLNISTPHLLLPQSAAGNYEITLANGNKYTTKINTLELRAAQKTVLTITIQRSGVTVGNVSVAPWSVGDSGSGGSRINDVQIASGSIAGITQPGTLHIATRKDGEPLDNDTDNKYFTSTYPVKIMQGLPIFDNTSTLYLPLLWDNLVKYNNDGSLHKLEYRALYIPSEIPSNNNEKDYLTGVTNPTTWGYAPTFTASADNDRRLKHAMTKFTVKLRSGAGVEAVTAAELSTAQVTVKSKWSIQSNIATASLSMKEGSKNVTPYNISSDRLIHSFLVCPQVYSSGDVVVEMTIRINGVVTGYTLYAPEKGYELRSGVEFVLTAAVRRTTVKASIDVVEWVVENAQGDFQ